jgi:hypothetical protein
MVFFAFVRFAVAIGEASGDLDILDQLSLMEDQAAMLGSRIGRARRELGQIVRELAERETKRARESANNEFVGLPTALYKDLRMRIPEILDSFGRVRKSANLSLISVNSTLLRPKTGSKKNWKEWLFPMRPPVYGAQMENWNGSEFAGATGSFLFRANQMSWAQAIRFPERTFSHCNIQSFSLEFYEDGRSSYMTPEWKLHRWEAARFDLGHTIRFQEVKLYFTNFRGDRTCLPMFFVDDLIEKSEKPRIS